MATYSCDCRKPADWLLREVAADGTSVPMGKAWAACNAHVARAFPTFAGLTVRITPVSPTWAAHVARRNAENARVAAEGRS